MPITNAPPHLWSTALVSTALTVTAVAALVVPVLTTPDLAPTASVSAEQGAGAVERNLAATTIDLGTLGGYRSGASAIDGSIVVGWSKLRGGGEHAFAYDLAAERPEMIDLGSLEGSSEATDVSGTYVVGEWNSYTDENDFRAFVYDLAADQPEMVDLGTLGGDYARANDVHGTLITGYSETATGEEHAFVYDLAADEPAMVDLGTLDGRSTRALASDGSVVVGVSDIGEPGDYHAFAYDLAAAEPVMRDLGTLGGARSLPVGVDRRVVTGTSDTATGVARAFAYDLDADEPAMEDLGTLGGDGDTWAKAMDGTTVVGFSHTPSGEMHPFSVDIAAGDPELRDLGTVGGAATPWVSASAVDGDLVIGDWNDRRGDWSTLHGFVYDLGAEQPLMLDPGNWQVTHVRDVSDDVVVGSVHKGTSGRELATAWVLRETTRPMFAFNRVYQPAVGENAGRVKIRVTRYGRLNRAVSVRYRTRDDSPRDDTAQAGEDFEAASGKLRFPRGVTRRTFTVTIKNDRLRESDEYVTLTLRRPGKPAVLGAPNWSLLRIKPNDR